MKTTPKTVHAPAPKKRSFSSARKDGRPHVFWTMAEHQRLADEIVRIQLRDPGKTVLAAIRDAQFILPEERRRPLSTTAGEKRWLNALLPAAREKAREKAAQEKAAQEKQAEVEAVETTMPLPAAGSTAEEPQQVPESLATIGAMYNTIRALLVDELAAVIAEATLKAIGSKALGEPPQIKVEPSSFAGSVDHRIRFQRPDTKPSLPSVLIVGLKGSQKVQIEHEFSNRYSMRFVGSDESKDQLRSMTEKADATVVVTDFVSHSMEAIVKARSPFWLRASGGLTSLRHTLSTLKIPKE